MTTIFIAVQCFECSTMQVKQQKKSSNKWNCVICNRKQSIRKVFARGFQAKDVRKFVQGFNMARQVADETLISPQEEEQIVDDSQNNSSVSMYQGKRRHDWSEYLDPEEQEEDRTWELGEEGKGGEYEPEIVTELPTEMFNKPRLSNNSAGFSKPEGKKLYSPTFAKRKPNNKPRNSQVKIYSGGMNKAEGKKLYSPTFAKRKTDNKDDNPLEHKGAGKSQPTMGQGPSKWSDYLAQDEDYLSFGTSGDLSDALGPWNHGMFETSFDDPRVEDEVHPDFH